MSGMGLLRAQLGDANSPFWWAAKLIGLVLLYAGLFTTPRPQSGVGKGQGICTKGETQFVCSCVQKPPSHRSLSMPEDALK
jgi:hypothetical protein